MTMAGDPLLVGLDVGTTTVKALIFDTSGRTVAHASAPTPTHYPRPAWAYYRPEELWQTTAGVLRQAVDRVEDAGRIASVAVASIGETGIPLDAGGRPTYDAIAWFDRRTEPQVEWLEHTVGRDRLFALTGLSLQPIFGLCKILWLKERQPEAFARTVSWLNTADYIAYRLSGVPATDHSLASRTLAFDLHRREWAEDLLREVGISPSLFAPPVPSGTPLGPVLPDAARQTGLPETVRVAVGGHDHICGALAVGVTEPGAMLNSLGTAEAICMPMASPLSDPEIGRQGYTVCAHVVPDRTYILGGLYTSGASIEWLREILGNDADYETLIAEATRVPPGSLGACFLPHLRLAGPPQDDPASRGAFVGLSTDVKRPALFRAVLEGLAYESRHTTEGILTHPGVEPLREICAIGGGIRNRLWMQIKATVLNRTIVQAEVAEATALGAAILGGLAAGVFSDIPSALSELRYPRTPIQPLSDQVDVYEACYQQVYRQIYPALRDLHHTVHRLQDPV